MWAVVRFIVALRLSLEDRLGSPALARADWPGPGRHPGHPTAEGGLPASKPGLRAGTRDLRKGSTTRDRVSRFAEAVSII